MYKVKIQSFEGPFDLLVYLLENARMDIYDINISEITRQYIDYLRQMESMDIEVGSEFIVLAAVLIRLKSRMLLPRVNKEGDTVIDEDPRAELAARILEYRRTKRIAEMLQKREEYMEAVLSKPGEDISQYLNAPVEILDVSSQKFVSAFLDFLERRKRVTDVRTRYQRARSPRESIEERIKKMSRLLEEKLKDSSTVSFFDLVPDHPDRYDMILSFSSLREMMKTQGYDARQSELFGEILVEKGPDFGKKQRETEDSENTDQEQIELTDTGGSNDAE